MVDHSLTLPPLDDTGNQAGVPAIMRQPSVNAMRQTVTTDSCCNLTRLSWRCSSRPTAASAAAPATAPVSRASSTATSTPWSANRPTRVPLAASVRFTEDGQQLLIGDGLWNTLRARGPYRLFVTDVRRAR